MDITYKGDDGQQHKSSAQTQSGQSVDLNASADHVAADAFNVHAHHKVIFSYCGLRYNSTCTVEFDTNPK
ncbi:MAG: hypothetical protein M3Z46_13230 [Actinomycetota bacterium]|nr:hypothetical protein [Actinomycetota bacterium]